MEHLAQLLEYPREESRQELYTRTFDLNPECSLDIGWHLFGEEYARGAFLVKMRQELQKHGIPESRELPDHLTHVLRLLTRMDPEEARIFASRFVLPALEKMLAAISKENPYASLLEEIREGVRDLCPALT